MIFKEYEITTLNEAVQLMRSLIAQSVKEFSEVDYLRPFLDYNVEQLFNFLKAIYKTERQEVFQTARITALINEADCDDQAIFAAAWFIAQGVPKQNVRLVFSWNTPGEYHVFIRIIDPSGSLIFDPYPGTPFLQTTIQKNEKEFFL